ncbi:ABC transporter ATP-binding protein [Pseudomonas brassicacearum]|uniref:ABC transporter ATP-binding protein n=1 Tax=Pseudomonas brassicacearum TaxID=930166 RepID=UPI00085996D1|nr:ABC transporter ATP-binding protein [Pseudomonas brassicacearum]AOS37385.1 ABC transporter ATP-binding protein [Pseudomonas brassicacearum]
MTNVAGTDSDAPLVSLKNVSKTFSTNQSELLVVEDFTLNIFEGESIALLGSSGCGKSTLLRMLVGLDTDYKGEILVDGHPVKGIDQERGMVFQEHRLFPWLTVAMNIELGLLNDALTPAQRCSRVSDYIKLVGLDGFGERYPHQLSGGMAQRVAIARGLVSSPRILLLDEPFGALDAHTRAQMQQELLRIRDEFRITMILVTHDIEEAIFVADRVILLDPRPGRIAKIVSIEDPHPRSRTSFEFNKLQKELLYTMTGDEAYADNHPRLESLPLSSIAL